MVTFVFLATSAPKIWKLTLLEPTGTVTAGTMPITAGLLLSRATGASKSPVTGPVMVIVTVAGVPATAELGLMLIDFSVTPPGGFTSNWPKSSAVPRVAAIVMGHWKAVRDVVIGNDALIAPAGTVTLAGT